jgi:surfactin synthase thioesterase subunit
LISRQTGPLVRLRLFCFPFAGGSATAYQSWRRLASPGLQVCGVEYPGRGTCFDEEPFMSLPGLVRHLADQIGPLLDRPFAFFGHSMGGLVAFELARTLRERGWRAPAHLFISATAEPARPPHRAALYRASDEEVLDELRDLGGTPPELLADRELMAMTARVLRADYTALGTYEYRRAAPLAVPMTVFGGRADPITAPADLRGWQAQTVAGCRFRMFPGDHFYLHAAAAEILRAVEDTVDDHLKSAVPAN